MASVPSDRTLTSRPMTKAGKRRFPDHFKPELATLVDRIPTGDWHYEIKFDGYRMLARVHQGHVTLYTRNGLDWTQRMPRQAAALAALKLGDSWLDGEMVVVDDDDIPDFQALQNAFDQGNDAQIRYYLFDAPWLDGEDLTNVAVEQRRAILAKRLEGHDDAVLRFSADLAEAPRHLLDSACRLGMEGLIGKRSGSGYQQHRSSDWIKLKCQRRQEFVIVGYTDPKGSREGLGALLLALHDEASGELTYAGKVGTGFDRAGLLRLKKRLAPLTRQSSPLPHPPREATADDVHWVRPQLLAEVSFAQMTREGVVRHAVFQGLREDKPAAAITRDEARTLTDAKDLLGKVRITHPQRVMDTVSGITKGDLAHYYAGIAPWMLPHLKQRPVALVRAPEGIEGELFFQKNPRQLPIPGVKVIEHAQGDHAAMLLNNAEALLGAVQMGSVEFHTWNATADRLEKPDRFILDLDPDPALPWRRMAQATELTLAVLDELGLKAFLKTSGGKGMHIVVPIEARLSWDEVKGFSQGISRHLATQLPELFTATSGPRNRVGKIFIDYLRNGLGATTACVYAVRAREGLPVSMPVEREEVAHLKTAAAWTLRTALEHLEQLTRDPWADYFSTRQRITRQMRQRLDPG